MILIDEDIDDREIDTNHLDPGTNIFVNTSMKNHSFPEFSVIYSEYLLKEWKTFRTLCEIIDI